MAEGLVALAIRQGLLFVQRIHRAQEGVPVGGQLGPGVAGVGGVSPPTRLQAAYRVWSWHSFVVYTACTIGLRLGAAGFIGNGGFF